MSNGITKADIEQYLSACKNANVNEEFITHLYDIVEDKENYKRALWLFVNGYLPYDTAIGNEPINIKRLRLDVLEKRKELRALQKARQEQLQRLADYLNKLKTLHLKLQDGKGILVFIDDGKIVAFAMKRGEKVEIIGAKCLDVDLNWNLHEHLGHLRRIKKSFYRLVKQAAYNEPRSVFNFQEGV